MGATSAQFSKRLTSNKPNSSSGIKLTDRRRESDQNRKCYLYGVTSENLPPHTWLTDYEEKYRDGSLFATEPKDSDPMHGLIKADGRGPRSLSRWDGPSPSKWFLEGRHEQSLFEDRSYRDAYVPRMLEDARTSMPYEYYIGVLNSFQPGYWPEGVWDNQTWLFNLDFVKNSILGLRQFPSPLTNALITHYLLWFDVSLVSANTYSIKCYSTAQELMTFYAQCRLIPPVQALDPGTDLDFGEKFHNHTPNLGLSKILNSAIGGRGCTEFWFSESISEAIAHSLQHQTEAPEAGLLCEKALAMLANGSQVSDPKEVLDLAWGLRQHKTLGVIATAVLRVNAISDESTLDQSRVILANKWGYS